MEPWQRIKQLRKQGAFVQALQEGNEFLRSDNSDFMLKSQLEWVCFDLIKNITQEWKEHEVSNRMPPADIRERLLEQVRAYAMLKPKIPDMASANILAKLCPIAKYLEEFPAILKWFFDQDRTGKLALPEDSWKPGVWNVRVIQSTAVKVARALAAWVKTHPETATSQTLTFALETCERILLEAEDEDKLWLQWDLASLHRLAGNFEEAETLLKSVLKAKRSEFWVWAEAGRLYREHKPGLAKSCFCQAARLGKDPKFLGKVHISLAELLAQQGEYGQATHEAVTAAAIYDNEGWAHPKVLESLLVAEWYDPRLSHDAQEAFYAEHAEQALTLCYDSSETVFANFIGLTEGREGKKPLPRFAVPGDNGAESILGKRTLHTDSLKPGQPLELTIAKEDSRRDILDFFERTDGSRWDVVDLEPALIARVFDDGKHVELYFDRERHYRVPVSVLTDDFQPQVGDGAKAGIVHVGKEGHAQVAFAEPAPQPDIKDFRVTAGTLKKMDAGFGFIEDVFVAPHFLDDFPDHLQEAGAMAVVKWNKKREEWGWQAISISQINQSETVSN